jgi:hypothetical protein
MTGMLEFENDGRDLIQELRENGHLFREAHKFFHRTFHELKYSTFQDVPMSMAAAKPVIDVYKFDDWLHCKFGDYEKEGMSMKDVLVKNYGAVVACEIERLVG